MLLALSVLLLIGPNQLFRLSQEYWLIAWQSFALAAASQSVLNLIPSAVVTRDETLSSDGLGIIVSLLRPTSHYAQWIGQTREGGQPELANTRKRGESTISE